jgi:hypothetical protein
LYRFLRSSSSACFSICRINSASVSSFCFSTLTFGALNYFNRCTLITLCKFGSLSRSKALV